MNDKTGPLPGDATPFPVNVPSETSVHIPGGVHTDFPDGSHLVEGPDGDRYLVSESGDINATLPIIRRVQIDDLSQVVSHQIAQVHDTTSHTLHFAGGGVFSYLHHRDGRGMSIHGRQIVCRPLAGGVIMVCGSIPANGTPGRTSGK